MWNAAENNFYFKKDSKVFQKIAKKFGKTIEELNSELQKRSYLLYEMQRRKIFDFEQNQKIINQYHKNPDAVLAAFGINIASNKTQ
jgi:phosphoenolpyruvate synthase/pyruvate phosphate dikinase